MLWCRNFTLDKAVVEAEEMVQRGEMASAFKHNIFHSEANDSEDRSCCLGSGLTLKAVRWSIGFRKVCAVSFWFEFSLLFDGEVVILFFF